MEGALAAGLTAGVIRGEDGSDVWNTQKFSFIEEDSPAPDTVNPSLWRQSQLVLKGGLFKVTDRLYQVRNADLSNLTLVEGESLQKPQRRANQRDEEAIEHWKEERWPSLKKERSRRAGR